MPVLSPGKFVPHKPGGLFAAFGDYATILLVFALIAPGGFFIFLSTHHRLSLGLVGLAIWTLALWCILVRFHRLGYVRIGLSASLAAVVYGILAFVFTNG
jgi:hypothetical protein